MLPQVYLGNTQSGDVMSVSLKKGRNFLTT